MKTGIIIKDNKEKKRELLKETLSELDYFNASSTELEEERKKLATTGKDLQQNLSRIDLLLNDITHVFELASLNASNLVKLAVTFKKVLIKRREIKDKMEIVTKMTTIIDDIANLSREKTYKFRTVNTVDMLVSGDTEKIIKRIGLKKAL